MSKVDYAVPSNVVGEVVWVLDTWVVPPRLLFDSLWCFKGA